MKVLYLLREMDRESSTSTVVFNTILNLDIKKEIICIGKSQQNNYKEILDSKKIKYTEFDSLADAMLNLQSIIKIVKNYDILHLDTYRPFVLGDIIKRINPNIKLLSTCYSSEIHESELHDYKGDSKIASLVRLREKRNFYQKHDKVIAVSTYVQDYLREIGCNNSDIIYNGIDYNELVQTKKEITKTIHFAQVGIMFRLKNQFFSVHLIKYLKDKGLDVKLHLVGNPNKNENYTNKIKEFIELNDLEDTITIHGFVETDALHKILSISNIYLMPSLVDGLPLALLEAFYFELPAIVSQYGGMKEVMTLDNGLIVNVDNQEDFEKIYQYCESKRYIQDGKNAKEIAIKKHNANIMAQKYLNAYEKLLDESDILNTLKRKKVYLFPHNNRMKEFEATLLDNRIAIYGYINNIPEFIAQNTFDYIVVDNQDNYNKILAYCAKEHIILI